MAQKGGNVESARVVIKFTFYVFGININYKIKTKKYGIEIIAKLMKPCLYGVLYCFCNNQT